MNQSNKASIQTITCPDVRLSIWSPSDTSPESLRRCMLNLMHNLTARPASLLSQRQLRFYRAHLNIPCTWVSRRPQTVQSQKNRYATERELEDPKLHLNSVTRLLMLLREKVSGSPVFKKSAQQFPIGVGGSQF